MTRAPAPPTEALERVERLRAKLTENRATLRDLRHRARVGSTPPVDASALEAADRALLDAKAAASAGLGSEADILAASERVAALRGDRARERAEAADELRVATRAGDLIADALAEATAELDRAAAERMRPAVTAWLGALAAFIEANDRLHAAELDAADAGMTPPVTAARDVALVSVAGSRTRIAWALAHGGWPTHYGDDIARHRGLTRSPMLAREAAAQAEREAKRATEVAKRAPEPAPAPARRPSGLRKLATPGAR